MQYDVITIDTQTVEHNGFHFDGGLLAQLKQFKDGPVRVIVSEIVIREIFHHLVEKTRSAKDAHASAQKRAIDFGLLSPAENLQIEPDIKAVARTRFNRFLNEIGAQIIKADDVSVRELIGLYFNSAPPFSPSGKKKNEFPDAIALLSLDAWAKTNNKSILAVSGDKDWCAFAESNPRINVTKDDFINVAVLVVFERDSEAQQFRIASLEIVDGPNSIDFGYVEPDYEPEYEPDYDLPSGLPTFPKMSDEVPF